VSGTSNWPTTWTRRRVASLRRSQRRAEGGIEVTWTRASSDHRMRSGPPGRAGARTSPTTTAPSRPSVATSGQPSLGSAVRGRAAKAAGTTYMKASASRWRKTMPRTMDLVDRPAIPTRLVHMVHGPIHCFTSAVPTKTWSRILSCPPTTTAGRTTGRRSVGRGSPGPSRRVEPYDESGGAANPAPGARHGHGLPRRRLPQGRRATARYRRVDVSSEGVPAHASSRRAQCRGDRMDAQGSARDRGTVPGQTWTLMPAPRLRPG